MRRLISLVLALLLGMAAAIPAAAEDIAVSLLNIDLLGVVNVTNKEGETLRFVSANQSYTGTMTVFDAEPMWMVCGTSSMYLTVPPSEAFAFVAETPGLGITVSDEAYIHASSDKAQTLHVTGYARKAELLCEGNFDYRLFLIDRDETFFDTINVTGTANGSVSITLQADGSVLLSGVAAGGHLSANGNHSYDIPAGHSVIRLTGSPTELKASDADGEEITLTYRPIIPTPAPAPWYSDLPLWLQMILRYLCFGWIWMQPE